jgi:hypothetical protein
MLFELDHTTSPVVARVVPAEMLWMPGCTVCVGTVYDAVICDDPDIPKLMPLELAKLTVPLVAVCVPAAIPPRLPVAVAPAPTLAVILVEPDIPNVTPFESAMSTVPDVAVCVPAASPAGPVMMLML